MTDKAYEDVSDEDVRALAEERRKHREEGRAKLGPGVYRTKVKVQKPLLDVPERGRFAGQVQVLLTHAVLDSSGDEVLGAVIFNRLALPLPAPGKSASQKGLAISLDNVLKLLKLQDSEDYEADAKKAVEASKKAAAGDTVLQDLECFVRLTPGKSYKDKNTGEEKTGMDVRIAQFLRKGEELSSLPGQSNSDILDFACSDD